MALISPLLLASLLLGSLARTEEPKVYEHISKEGFPINRPFLDGDTLPVEAAGLYLRAREGRTLYALCLYVDLGQLRSLAGKPPYATETLAELLVEGKVRHAFITRFVQALPRTNRMAYLIGNLGAAWPRGIFDPTAPSLQPFLAFFDKEVTAGTETQVWVGADAAIVAREPGKAVVRTQDADLAKAFTASYLGPRPMDPMMKDQLLKDIILLLNMQDLFSAPVIPSKGRKVKG